MKMIHIATVWALIAVGVAHARIKPYTGSAKSDNPEYSEMYLAGGTAATETDAFMAAIRGDKVYRCILQEVSMGKTGKSASLKNVKKRM